MNQESIQTDNQDQLFKAMFDHATLGIIMVDDNGKIMEANTFANQLFGYRQDELVGQKIELLIPPKLKKKHVQERQSFIKNPKPRPMGSGQLLFGLHKSGRQFPVEISLSHTSKEDRQIVIAFISDITQRQEILTNLQESEARISAIINSAVDGIITINEKGIIQTINPAAAQLFAYSADEVIGQNVSILMPANDQKAHDGYLSNYKNSGKRKIIGIGRKVMGKKKDGTTFPVHLSISEAVIKRKKIYTGILHDLTEKEAFVAQQRQIIHQLRLQEKEILREKELAQTYLEMAGSIIVVLNQDETVALINHNGCEILGLKEEEIIGKNWFNHFIPEKDRAQTQEVFHKLIKFRSTKVETWENEVITSDRKTTLISWFNRLLKNDKDQVIGTISSGIDITEQKQMEQDLKESKAKLEQTVIERTRDLRESESKLIEAQKIAGIGYWELDLITSELKWSETLYQIFGLDSSVPVTMDLFLQTIHQESRETIKNIIHEANNSSKRIEYNFKIITPDGQLKYLHGFVEKRIENDHPTTKVFGVTQDITIHKNAEEQLEHALQKEKELNELKSRFVSMASHEFRTPLTSILGSTDLIELYAEKGRTDKFAKQIRRIKSSVDNLTSILNDFLSLEKLESGKVFFQPEVVKMKSFIQQLLEEVSLLTKDNQKINVKHQGVDEVLIDKHLVKNIILNLVSNAIKYSPANKDVDLHTVLQENTLVIEVKDRGIGIPEKDQKLMFNRFFRASNVENIKGTGLGLTIVKRYLDVMGGSISFTSKEGKGTTFQVKIPQSFDSRLLSLNPGKSKIG